jgi:hypothetical protein
VENADPVSRREAVADPLRDRETAAERQDPLLLLDFLQSLPREVLHRHELFALDLDEVVNAADVLVGDPAGQDDFPAQRLPPFRREPVGADPLQGDFGVELQIPGAVNDPHAAEPQHLVDAVAAAEDRPGSVGDFAFDGSGSGSRAAPLARRTFAFPGHF